MHIKTSFLEGAAIEMSQNYIHFFFRSELRKSFSKMGSNTSLLGILALALGFSGVALSVTPTNTSSPDLTRLPAFKSKPRVFILSDILAEVDDSESFVRYLLYSNEFDTRGLCK